MYNAEFKERYLNENEYRNKNLRTYMTMQFDNIAEMESALGKDAYDFTTKEILEYYKMRVFASLETLMNLNSQLANYTRFAISCNLVKDCQNHYEELYDNSVLNECINTSLTAINIFTRQQLMEMANDVVNPFEKFMMYAFFEGIRGNQYCEILDLTEDCFDIEKQEVHLCTGRVLHVSKELIDTAIESANEYMYYVLSKNGGYRTVSFKPDDNRVIKCRMNAVKEKRDYHFVNVRMIRMIDNYGFTGLKPSTLEVSGRIDMIKKYMAADNCENYEETFFKHRNEIEYRYGKVGSVRRWFLKYGKYFEG